MDGHKNGLSRRSTECKDHRLAGATFSPSESAAMPKTGLVALARSLVHQLSPKNIRVNCVSPGTVKTHFGGQLWQSQTAAEENVKTVPMKRFAEPEEIAGAVSFLASDDASYITGENIVVSGGMTARL
ncbi:hypothetical protein CHS0354_034797 [Potamilus streckersoni]|uniref:Uncharacterized protein n=1 Tax=Potamilus streckersoni TaxID=2493646 RepID=A0AAE0VJG8_9BIVA|nr:hypothetical protein CHS0354_034797 [Potamilus streckersoni]